MTGYNEIRPSAVRVASGSDGDRMVTCSKGHEHWGAYGAAGLLMRHKGEDGQVRYLLQKRSPAVDHPDTWSIPSGARGKDESPEDGALREFREEMGALPRGTSHRSTTVSTDCGDWKFHTVSYDSPELFTPRGRGETDHEIAGAGWFAPREVKHLDLHPAFAKSWDNVRKSASVRRDHSSAGGVSLDVQEQESTKLEPREGVAGYDVAPRSGMIYLPIPEGLIERVPGGVDDEPHITVVYLGKGLSDEAFGTAMQRAAEAGARSKPLHGVLRGTGTFPPSEASDGKTPVFVPAYVPGISQLRRELEDLSASEHQDYRPHVTLAYLEDGDPVPPSHPARQVSFTHLHVKRGDQVVRFPLGAGIRTEARSREPTSSFRDMHRIIDRTHRNGGHSVSLTSGRSPSGGYMVAQQEGSHFLPAHEFFGPQGHHVLRSYIQGHASHFAQPGAHLGTWHDHESGNVFLDISHNVHGLEGATRMAQHHNQIAIWDLKNKQEIPTGGTGGLDKVAAADSCERCGLPAAKVSATMEFLRRGGQDTLE
jgi:8-oxo-dGTP diphosphatase